MYLLRSPDLVKNINFVIGFDRPILKAYCLDRPVVWLPEFSIMNKGSVGQFDNICNRPALIFFNQDIKLHFFEFKIKKRDLRLETQIALFSKVHAYWLY